MLSNPKAPLPSAPASVNVSETEQTVPTAELLSYRQIILTLAQQFPTVPDAIRAFLRQKGHPDSYLTKIIGTRSRASELLSGKRPPSLSDLRALRVHLGLPSDLLLTLTTQNAASAARRRFPVTALCRRGLIPEEMKKKPEEVLSYLTRELNLPPTAAPVRLRQTPRCNAKTDPYTLQVWLLCVRKLARDVQVTGQFSPRQLKNELGDIIGQLGSDPRGPAKIPDFLAARGIRFVMLPHLKGTYLDGAALLGSDGIPIVALTGRYDRLDNFWFSLLHELAHLAFGHVTDGNNVICDDLDLQGGDDDETDADHAARTALISDALWEKFSKIPCNLNNLVSFAIAQKLPPAVIAGRIRYERQNYRLFSGLLGQGEVRAQFPDVFAR